ncbi:MAG: hypothetical protein Q8K75_07815 [Chlamydiales bacterium]|nr:hypothetical protein [Chlamydiales bacterium]
METTNNLKPITTSNSNSQPVEQNVPSRQGKSYLSLILPQATIGLDPGNREKFVCQQLNSDALQLAIPLFTPTMECDLRLTLVEKAEQILTLVSAPLVAPLLTATKLETESTWNYVRAALSDEPSLEKRDSLVQHTCTLVTDAMMGRHFLSIFRALTWKSPEDGASLSQHTLSLTTETMNSDERLEIFRELSGISTVDRESMIEHTRKLVEGISETGGERSLILSIIRDCILPANRASVVSNTLSLITASTNVAEREYLLRIVSHIPQANHALIEGEKENILVAMQQLRGMYFEFCELEYVEAFNRRVEEKLPQLFAAR